MAWILLSELRSCLSFASYRPPRCVVWHFVILLSSYTYEGHGPQKNPSVDSRLGTTDLGGLFHMTAEISLKINDIMFKISTVP